MVTDRNVKLWNPRNELDSVIRHALNIDVDSR